MIFNLSNRRVFPEGTALDAYPADDFVITPPVGPPEPGMVPTGSATVTGGVAAFDLPVGGYYVHGLVGTQDRYLFVRVAAPVNIGGGEVPWQDFEVVTGSTMWRLDSGFMQWRVLPGPVLEIRTAGVELGYPGYADQAFEARMPGGIPSAEPILLDYPVALSDSGGRIETYGDYLVFFPAGAASTWFACNCSIPYVAWEDVNAGQPAPQGRRPESV